MNLLKFIPFLIFTLLFISSNRQNIIYKKNGIEVYGVTESKENINARLDSFNYDYSNINSEYKIKYSISNYELKADSKNNLTGLCANSKDGQHIHSIIDNKPYTAIYKTDQIIKEDNQNHLALSFLSRSHHQSIKHKNAFKLIELNPNNNSPQFNLKKPYLFYSRPKGTYIDKDTREILLDFFLVNTSISPKANKVKITIDSIHTFYIQEWKPYLIKGLSMGDHIVTLNLVDKKFKSISTPFLPVTRKFTLQQSPATIQ